MRKIIHVDMDAFFAAIEQRDEPTLRGEAVIVGGTPEQRGVVAAASYEARKYGVKSAMSTARALRLCPHAHVLGPDFKRYRAESHRIRAIFHSCTPLVEMLSLDEGFLDVSRNALRERSATRVAEYIRERIRSECGLTASAGVAPNKFLAKIASDQNKPDGCCVIPPDRIETFLADLAVRRIPGIGPATEKRCQQHGIHLVPDILRADEAALAHCFGSHADRYRQLAQGIDERPVEPRRERKSVGIEDTFAEDLRELPRMEEELRRLAAALKLRMIKHRCTGRTLTLKVKYHDFTQCSRSRSYQAACFIDADDIAATACTLLAETDAERTPIRLLGLQISGLEPVEGAQHRLQFDD